MGVQDTLYIYCHGFFSPKSGFPRRWAEEFYRAGDRIFTPGAIWTTAESAFSGLWLRKGVCAGEAVSHSGRRELSAGQLAGAGIRWRRRSGRKLLP